MNRIVIRAPKFARKVATDISWIMLIISHWLLVSYPTRSGCWEKNVHLRPTYNSDVWIVGEWRTSKWTLNHTNNITKITQPIAHPSGGYFLHNLYSLCFKIKVTFGEISLKLRQINWNVAKINVNVVVDELPSQITIHTCSTIDIWTRRRRRTSTRFSVLRCHPHKMAGFQTNWRQKLSTLLWTPLACPRMRSVRTMQCT